MKIWIYLLLPCLFISCNDGDLQIETIDFDTAGIQYCETTPTTNSSIFFKLNTNEALILELQNGILKNEASGGQITSTVPGQSKIAYRTFSANVSKNYFCDDIPPTTPTVIEEIEAEGGEVFITTVQSEADTTMYEHTIEFSGISLVNAKGERITDLTINNFGTITTSE
ncbi:MAG TPA: hypothetical protein VKN36_08480 [Eudoraea sp.]|nr:hypothetical protein [Eudoraea sp.]